MMKKCSECGKPAHGYWVAKGKSGATYHTDNKTCGRPVCQRARKSRLQRERRAKVRQPRVGTRQQVLGELIRERIFETTDFVQLSRPVSS